MSHDEIPPVKLISGILFSNKSDLKECLRYLENKFSSIDFLSPEYPFDYTRYYESEMGTDLLRVWVSFEELVNPEILVESKYKTREIEKGMSLHENRSVNLDPGYLDLFKIVLASFKMRTNKIYCGKGIWADMLSYFENARFKPFSWAFPDFQTGIYNDTFIEIRNRFKNQLKML